MAAKRVFGLVAFIQPTGLFEGGIFFVAHVANLVGEFQAAILPANPAVRPTEHPAFDEAGRTANDQNKQGQFHEEVKEDHEGHAKQNGGQHKTRHTIHCLVGNGLISRFNQDDAQVAELL